MEHEINIHDARNVVQMPYYVTCNMQHTNYHVLCIFLLEMAWQKSAFGM